MIKTLSLTKFKAFKELNNINIAPLTVILGKNSCGKSSILHSLLLLKQTIESGNKSSALNLDGKYLRYSSLSEISHELPTQRSASIKYSIEVADWTGNISSIEIAIKNKKDENSYHPVINYVKTTFNGKSINYGKLTTDKIKLLIKNKSDKFLLNFLNKYDFIESSVSYNKFIPDYISFNIKNTGEDNFYQGLTFPVEFLFDGAGSLEVLRQSLENIKYLSPVRATPQRAYIHYANDAFDLSEDGSNSAHVLWGRRNQEVKWKGKNLKLTDAVNECIKCMGLTQEIEPSRTGNLIYQIKVKIPIKSKSVTIADVGFGYSQIIPIVLTGLLNKEQNLMLIEQPEIHLHPSSCANLADLFLGFISDNKNFIIETHSQDLVNRLRLRVIEDPSLKKKINIVFIDTEESGASVARQFSIDENGGFPEWPAGFLDESEKAARAMIKARAGQTKNKKLD